MSKRNYFFKLFSIMLVISFFIHDSVVFADRTEVDSVIYVAENQTEILSICRQANDVTGNEILVYTGRDGLLSFSNSEYSKLNMAEKREFIETALVATKESGLGNKIKNKVYNFISEQDTTTSSALRYLRSDASADFAEAVSWFKPFGNAAGVVLGVLALFIFLLSSVSIAIDIAYLVVPGFRLLLELIGKKRYKKVETGEEVQGKPLLVSIEAYQTVIEVEDSFSVHGGEGKNLMSTYIPKRIPSLLIMSIALGYLISGQIYDVISYFIDAFSWIFDW